MFFLILFMQCMRDNTNLSSQKPRHTTGGSRLGAQGGGGAGLGRIVCQKNCAPGEHFFRAFKSIEDMSPEHPPRNTNKRISSVDRWGEQNPQLKTSSYAIYPQSIISPRRGALFLVGCRPVE